MFRRIVYFAVASTLIMACGNLQQTIDFTTHGTLYFIDTSAKNNTVLEATYYDASRASGKDNTFLTEDDRTMNYRIKSSNFSNITTSYGDHVSASGDIMFNYIGPDKRWFTEDDYIEYPGSLLGQAQVLLLITTVINDVEYRVTHFVAIEDFAHSYYGGKTLVLGTESIREIAVSRTSESNPNLKQYEAYNSSGADKTWFTADDSLVKDKMVFSNATHWSEERDGYAYEIIEYGDAGDDDINFTTDDIIRYRMSAILADTETGGFSIGRKFYENDSVNNSEAIFDEEGELIRFQITRDIDDKRFVESLETQSKQTHEDMSYTVTSVTYYFPDYTELDTVAVTDELSINGYEETTYQSMSHGEEQTTKTVRSPGRDGIWFTEDDEKQDAHYRIITRGDGGEKTIEEKKADLFNYLVNSRSTYYPTRSLGEHWH
ncbi:MAG: hypothetical protein OEZ43_20835 [Gammaproteobacteria bacterium]|nr:hypothetical protein [Gammaproteobacteria bacterium]